MNEKIVQSVISDLANTIAQLTVDLALERANVRDLSEQHQDTLNELNDLKAEAEVKVVE